MVSPRLHGPQRTSSEVGSDRRRPRRGRSQSIDVAESKLKKTLEGTVAAKLAMLIALGLCCWAVVDLPRIACLGRPSHPDGMDSHQQSTLGIQVASKRSQTLLANQSDSRALTVFTVLLCGSPESPRQVDLKTQWRPDKSHSLSSSASDAHETKPSPSGLWRLGSLVEEMHSYFGFKCPTPSKRSGDTVVDRNYDCCAAESPLQTCRQPDEPSGWAVLLRWSAWLALFETFTSAIDNLVMPLYAWTALTIPLAHALFG